VSHESVRLERASSGRNACAHCNAQIWEGIARIVERSQTSYHLDCAVQARPELVRKVLLGREPVDPALVPDRNELMRRVRCRLDEQVKERRAAAAGESDPVLDPLFAQLEAEPGDRALLAVLADALSERGDPRGELITSEIAAEARPQAPLPGRRRDELRARLVPAFGDIPAKISWDAGFISRLEVQPQTAPRTARLAEIWKHPSVRLLGELAITGPAGPLMHAWFPALRRLELASRMTPVGPVGDIVAAMPRLEYLALAGSVERIDLAHPTLVELRFDHNDHLLHALDRDRLPALRRIAVSVVFSYGALLDAGWGQQLTHLAIQLTTLPVDFAARLEAALDGRKLVHLDLTGSKLMCSARALRGLCETLTAQVEPKPGMSVRHREKPEWGLGRIVGTSPGKIEIEFDIAGRKTLRDTLPHLAFDED
jgi:hypothetical protein